MYYTVFIIDTYTVLVDSTRLDSTRPRLKTFLIFFQIISRGSNNATSTLWDHNNYRSIDRKTRATKTLLLRLIAFNILQMLLILMIIMSICLRVAPKSTRSNKAPLGSVRVGNVQRAKLNYLSGPQGDQNNPSLLDRLKRKGKVVPVRPTKKQEDAPLENLLPIGNIIKRDILGKMDIIKLDVNIVNENVVLSDKQKLKFMRDGHIRINDLFSAIEITNIVKPSAHAAYDSNKLIALRHKVSVTFGAEDFVGQPLIPESLSVQECELLLAKVDQNNIPFMQLFNLWKKNKSMAAISLSPTLGKIAADLLGVSSVRLYQDALFVKRPGDGPTQWHSDLNIAPFDSNDLVTCWIPLQLVPSEEDGGSGLLFATASHRDFAYPFWSDPRESDCSGRYEIDSYGSLEVGDCTFHHGWTLHYAPENSLSEARFAYSVSYIADGAILLGDDGYVRYPDDEDKQSYSSWIDEVGRGNFADHDSIPIVYMRSDDDEVNK